MSADLDVVVIGAGAAGIAAARRLNAAGRSILLVEAGDRVGGRAWTAAHDGLPLDLGCGWLHSGDRNAWAALAPGLGFSIDRTLPPWGEQAGGLGFPPELQAAARDAFAAFEERLRAAPPGQDRAADLLEPGQPWNGYLEALSGYINGAELAHLSIRDYLAYADAETGVNWRVAQGYGALVAAAAANLPVLLSTPVTAIETTGRGVRIVTGSGVIAAAAAVVTLPTDILASGVVGMPAGLADTIEAASNLPLGLADKIFLALDRIDGFEPDTQVLGRPGQAMTGSYHLRPLGRPLIEGFFGGATARILEGEGVDAMARFALDELVGLYGAGIRTRLRLVAQSCWGRTPFVGGSYSHARPGHAAARSVLAAPFEDRLFFAGEACSAQDFSTAHGAYETGLAAAELILKRPMG
jgi:monoamine oxidase